MASFSAHRGVPLRTTWEERGLIFIALALIISIYQLHLSYVHVDTGLYTAGSYVSPYYGNLTSGDFVLLGGFGLLIFRYKYRHFIFRLMQSGMGFGFLVFAIIALLSAPFCTNEAILYNLKQAMQFAFNALVVVPIFAYLVSISQNPFRLFRNLSLVYILTVWIGAALHFIFGLNIVMQLYGDKRLMPNIGYDSLQYVVVSFFATALLSKSSNWDRLVALLGLATYISAAILAASRTMFIAGLAIMATSFIFGRNFNIEKKFVYILVATFTMCILYIYMFVGVQGADNVMVRYDGFGDYERINLIRYGLNEVWSNLQSVFFGIGWDESGIHNFLIQSFVDGGLLVCIAFIAVFIRPIYFLWKSRINSSMGSMVGFGILTGFLVEYSLNALPTLRVYWLPLGIVVGLAFRQYSTRVLPAPRSMYGN